MRKLLTFLKKQNPRRGGQQGFAGGWLEARGEARCQPKDPCDPNAVPWFPQAHLLSIGRAMCTTSVLRIGARGTKVPGALAMRRRLTFLIALAITANAVSAALA
jgi:hypothetical protein